MAKHVNITRLICIGLIIGGGGLVAVAQSAKDAYVIYTKAGRINQATGNVRLGSTSGNAGKVLAVGDDLADGDVVTTGTETKLEVLLCPGSYVRVGDDSELQMVDTALDDIRLSLNRGSAVIEAGGGPNEDVRTRDAVFRIQVDTAAGPVVINKRGIYRLNVTAGRTELLVLKGEATAGTAMTAVKSGRQIVLPETGLDSVAKFNQKEAKDALDIWSRDRAEFLAKANRSLNQRDFSQPFGQFDSVYNAQGLLPEFGGFWVFNRRLGFSFYMPFDLSFWDSPYGFGYGNCIFWWSGYGYPGGNYYPGGYGSPGNGSNGGGSNGGGTNGGGSSGSGSTRLPSLPQSPITVRGGTNGPLTAPNKGH